MGYKLQKDGFDTVLEHLKSTYRLYAPVRKTGEGRYTDVDVVRYDFIERADDIEFEAKSDYAFKELLTPLSETLFFFTENETKEADFDEKPVIVFLRSCDLHAVKRLDAIYLENGKFADPFYQRIRENVKFALIGCAHSFEDCFCVSMGTNESRDGYLFSVDVVDGAYLCDVKDGAISDAFSKNADEETDVTPRYVTENTVRVQIPEDVPNAIYKHELWDEYTARCINCGRCNFVCPTCSCYTMQDVFYTDNGKVGERRCDMVCPEYISYSNIINKVNDAVSETQKGGAAK